MSPEERAKVIATVKAIVANVSPAEVAAEIIIDYVRNCILIADAQRALARPAPRDFDDALEEQRAKDRERKRRQRENAPDVSPSLRYTILSRDGFRCVYCGAMASAVELHVDHVVPRSRGGETVPENLVTACQPCNVGKGDRA